MKARKRVRLVLCALLGHDDEHTDEYVNRFGYWQADIVCIRCGKRRRAWAGPEANE